MKAIILASGEGRRLRPLTDKLPKPMIPVMNRPIMAHLLRHLKSHGITEIGVTLGYRGDMIEAYFKDGHDFGVELTYFRETVPCGTAGSLRNATGFLKDDFIVLSGDAITDVNITSAVYFHKDKNALATLVLKEVSNPHQASVATTEEDGRIFHLSARPEWDESKSNLVNTGIYIMHPDVLSYIPESTQFDFVQDLIPALLAKKMPLYGYRTENYWCDIGSIEAYQSCHKDVFLGKIDLNLPTSVLSAGVLIGEGCQIANDATIERFSVIGDHSFIGNRSSVKNSIVWSGSHLPADSELCRTICCGLKKVYLPPESEESKKQPNPKQNVFCGVINDDITPEFLIRLTSAFADSLEKNPKILISLSDKSENMMLKFALLSGLIAAGAEAYNLLEAGDRSLAKFALRKLSLDGGVHVQIKGQEITLEILEKNGAPANSKLMQSIKENLKVGNFNRCDPALFKPPVNVNRMPLYYFKDLVATTPSKRLNFSIAICSDIPEIQSKLKKIGSAFGISLLFTNDEDLLPDLIQKNNLNFGMIIGENGKCGLLDEHGRIINSDTYYALVTLIVLSAVEGGTVLVPQHVSSVVENVAKACGGSVIRTADFALENALLKNDIAEAHLQYDLCFDPIRGFIRICEFLYLNHCTLSSVVNLFPVMYKISRSVDCPPERKGYIMRKILSIVDTDSTTDLTEGIKINSKKGWILIMPDVAGNKLRILSESHDAEFARELSGDICRKIQLLLENKNHESQ